jgi:hypothetical protein
MQKNLQDALHLNGVFSPAVEAAFVDPFRCRICGKKTCALEAIGRRACRVHWGAFNFDCAGRRHERYKWDCCGRRWEARGCVAIDHHAGPLNEMKWPGCVVFDNSVMNAFLLIVPPDVQNVLVQDARRLPDRFVIAAGNQNLDPFPLGNPHKIWRLVPGGRSRKRFFVAPALPAPPPPPSPPPMRRLPRDWEVHDDNGVPVVGPGDDWMIAADGFLGDIPEGTDVPADHPYLTVAPTDRR